jgi:cell division protein FtsW (lipid II flippase)
MSKKMAFWSIWSVFTAFMILFFCAIGELKQMDFGKSVILTAIPLVAAFPLCRWVKSNPDFH